MMSDNKAEKPLGQEQQKRYGMYELQEVPYDYHCDYPFDTGYRPISWGGDTGNANRMMARRISTIDSTLRDRGYDCLVGGDMNFVIGYKPVEETPERRSFVNQVMDKLDAKFVSLRQDTTDDKKLEKIDFIIKRLQQKRQSRNFDRLFKFCFMAELNRQMHDEAGIMEQNFSWCTGKDNPLSTHALKPFFDHGIPEFQMVPTTPEQFLNNTYRVYHAVANLGKKLGVKIEPDTEHIHLSIHKGDKNITTRTDSNPAWDEGKQCWGEEEYHPAYRTLLAGVHHMTKTNIPLLGLSTPVMVTETKVGRGDSTTIRACPDNIEFRCNNNQHLTAGLLTTLAGIQLAIDELEGQKTFEKYRVKTLDAATIAVTDFRRTKQKAMAPIEKQTVISVLVPLLSRCVIGNDHKLHLHPSDMETAKMIDQRLRIVSNNTDPMLVHILKCATLEPGCVDGKVVDYKLTIPDTNLTDYTVDDFKQKLDIFLEYKSLPTLSYPQKLAVNKIINKIMMELLKAIPDKDRNAGYDSFCEVVARADDSLPAIDTDLLKDHYHTFENLVRTIKRELPAEHPYQSYIPPATCHPSTTLIQILEKLEWDKFHRVLDTHADFGQEDASAVLPETLTVESITIAATEYWRRQETVKDYIGERLAKTIVASIVEAMTYPAKQQDVATHIM